MRNDVRNHRAVWRGLVGVCLAGAMALLGCNGNQEDDGTSSSAFSRKGNRSSSTGSTSGADAGTTSAPVTATTDKVKTYSAPTGTGALPLYNDFSVTVDGLSSPVYQAKVGIQYTYVWPGPDPKNEPVGFTNFDVAGPVTAVIKVSNRTVTTAKVVPSSRNITPTVSGNTVTVSIPGPGKYEIQLNGSEHNPIYLFANPMEVNAPTAGSSKVIYYGPGVHNVGVVDIPSDTIVYLAGGAVVRGQLNATDVSNVVIRGRGILDGSDFATHDGNMVHLDSVGNAQIEGIVITNSPGWTVPVWYSNGVVIDNIKIFAHRQNSDGIDLVSDTNVEVKNSFVRNWDDGITVKAWNNVNANNYYIHDCILSSDYGNSNLEIGAEEQATDVSKIKFENIDIVHSHTNTVTDIGTGDQANIHDVTYDNIRVENHYGSPGYIQAWFAIWQEVGQWSGDAGFGKISNVTYSNINFLSGTKFGSAIAGGDSNHIVTNVSFSNIQYAGKPLKSAAELGMDISNASQIQFK